MNRMIVIKFKLCVKENRWLKSDVLTGEANANDN